VESGEIQAFLQESEGHQKVLRDGDVSEYPGLVRYGRNLNRRKEIFTKMPSFRVIPSKCILV